jgi:hypothetical protein
MRRLLFASLLVGAAACTPPPEPTERVAQPIYGGTMATTCQWPTTVLLPDDGCTGTLVHPRIVVTAAHCGTTERQIILGETRNAPARSVRIESCKVFQDENGPSRTDFAYCKLATPVTDVPIVPILMGCETAILKPGQKVIIAGFGDSAANKGYGTKRWAETTINRVGGGRAIQVGGNGIAPCFGDSGGPAFVQLPDGSWRVFGIDSAGLQESCAAGDLMALMHEGVSWIEQQSGIDITPCHDADGTWHPGPDCHGFSLTPDLAGRAWSNGCAEAALSPPLGSCGDPYGGDGGALEDDGGLRADAGARDLALDEGRSPPRPDGPRVIASPDAAPRSKPEPELDADVAPPVKTAHARGCSCELDGRGAGGLSWLPLLALLLRRRRARR